MVRSAAAMSGRRSSSVEGTATGIFGIAAGEQVRRDREFGRRPADQHGDGVLVLRALHADIDLLRLGGLDLGLGGGHVAGSDRR